MPEYENRLAALYQLNLLDSGNEPVFNNLVALAAATCQTKLAFITLIDNQRLWFKSAFGTDATEVPIKGSFCEQAITMEGFFEIQDTLNYPEFCTNSLVKNSPHVRFYAGYPLKIHGQKIIGTLCVLDDQPKTLSEPQLAAFKNIIQIAETLFEQELHTKASKAIFDTYLNSTSEAMCIVGNDPCFLLSFNQLFSNTIHTIYGVFPKTGEPISTYFHGFNLDNFLVGVSKAFAGEPSTVERLVNFEKFSVWYFMQYLPIRNQDGQVIAVAFTAKNVSNEHKYIDLLNETNELARVGGWEINYINKETVWTTVTRQIFEVAEEYQPNPLSFFDFINDENLSNLLRLLIDEAIHNKTLFKIEVPIITPNNTTKWLVLRGKPAFQDNQCVRIFGAVGDITRDKELRKSLLESREQYKGIIESSSDIIYELDIDGLFAFVSPVWTKLLGHDTEEVIGKSYMEYMHPDDIRRCHKFCRELFATRKADNPIEYRLLHKKGHYEWHESTCSTITRNGKLYIIGIGREITQWKIAQERLQHLNKQLLDNSIQLKDSEKRYSDLFRLSPQPMYMFSLEDFKITSVNEAAIQHYGYSRDEFLAKTILDMLPEQIQSDARIFLQTKAQEEGYYAMRSSHVKQDGTIFDVDVYSSQITINQQKFRLVLSIDMTKELIRSRAIEKQNEMFKEIAWMQSHVVRAPLANIMGLIEVIKSKKIEDVKRLDIVHHLLSEAEKFDEIIKLISKKATEANVIVVDGIDNNLDYRGLK